MAAIIGIRTAEDNLAPLRHRRGRGEGMPKYRVYGIFTASKFIGEFEADTPEAAENLAAESGNNYASLCHQCVDQIELNDCSASEFQVEEVEV